MKVLNKNFHVFNNDSELIVIPIIKPPKFYIGDTILTEYDVRNLQLEISLGNIEAESLNKLLIKDENDVILFFNKNGTLKSNPIGYRLISEMVLKMIANERKIN